jgi:hypothetical protein
MLNHNIYFFVFTTKIRLVRESILYFNLFSIAELYYWSVRQAMSYSTCEILSTSHTPVHTSTVHPLIYMLKSENQGVSLQNNEHSLCVNQQLGSSIGSTHVQLNPFSIL